MNVLAIGDVCGEIGLTALDKALPKIRQKYEPDLIIANGENADGLGITPPQVDVLLGIGVDVITLGNHTFSRRQLAGTLCDKERLLRPLNLTHNNVPGSGYVEVQCGGITVGVMCLIGQVDMGYNFGTDNPFLVAERQLSKSKADLIITDFHAEATSEKAAMAYHLDGIDNRAVALFGTHTHVQTSDERIFNNGLGFITDLGMSGAYNSIIGIEPEYALQKFLSFPHEKRGAPKQGKTVVEGAVFTIDAERKSCTNIERVRVFGEV